MAHDVFISYSSKDKPIADATCAVLEQSGIRCWIAPRDILPGKTWASSILEAINDSRVMVLVFSGNCNTSPQVEREVERAINKGIPLVPMRIEDIKPAASLEFFLSAGHWLDAFTEPLEQHLRRLAGVVEALLAGLNHPQKTGTTTTIGASGSGPAQAYVANNGFDIKKATAMIVAGQTPPEKWRPFISELHFDQSELRDLTPLTGLTELRTLQLWHTQVRDLKPIAGLTALKQLDVWDTPIDDLSPIAALAGLEGLKLQDIPVVDLTPIARLTTLRSLGLLIMSITDISLIANLERIEKLDLFKSPISDIRPISSLTDLESLSLWCTQVSNLKAISGLKKLRYLNISQTLVSDLSPVASLAMLESLQLRATPVNDLTPIGKLKALVELDLEGTAVGNLTPLIGLGNLRRLDISGTQVSNLAPLRRWLTALKHMDVNLMQSSDISVLSHLPNLKITRR